MKIYAQKKFPSIRKLPSPKVPYTVEKPVPYPVKVPVDRPYPVTVEKHIPVEKHVPVPVPVKVAVPVHYHHHHVQPQPAQIHYEQPAYKHQYDTSYTSFSGYGQDYSYQH